MYERSGQLLFQPCVNGLITMSFLLYLKSEPFNGQGSLPGGGGGYNAFTQAAVSGVGHNAQHTCLLWLNSYSDVLNTCGHRFSARPRRSDVRVSQFTNGRESNTADDTWDIHASLPVPRPGHKTTLPATRHQTQHHQPTALDR